jgi:RNA recognition motif-containing protein
VNQKLYVGNLPFSTDEQALEELFGQAGQVGSVRVMRDQATGRARGFAFVEMATEDGARTAIEKFHNTELGGRRLTVNEARPQTAGAGRGRGDFGGGGNRRREPRW